MKIEGIEGLSADDIRNEVERGGKFVVYSYVFSVLIMTFRRPSPIVFVRSGQSRVVSGLKYALISLFFGWWGFPWGFIYTPQALYVDLKGGRDVTNEVLGTLAPGAAS